MSEATFVVGQWVVSDTRVGVYRVTEVHHLGTFRVEGLLGGWLMTEDWKPFHWQVGLAYRTTLDGVAVRIVEIDSDGDVVGMPWEGSDYRHWRGRTGRLIGHDTDDAKPHLLPYLADEPPPVAEAATYSEFDDGNEADDVRGVERILFTLKERARTLRHAREAVSDELEHVKYAINAIEAIEMEKR